MLCVFVVIELLRWTQVISRCTRLRYFGGYRLRYFEHVSSGVGGCNTVPCRRCYPVTSVNTLHTLSCARLWRCARVFYVGEAVSSFVAHVFRVSVKSSCYVANVFCTSVRTLHVTLCTAFVIRWQDLMLHYPRICSFVRTFHVTLATFMFFGEDMSCYVVHVFFWTSVNTLRAHVVRPESKRKIDSCHLSQYILSNFHCKNTILFIDGARAYTRLWHGSSMFSLTGWTTPGPICKERAPCPTR